MAFCPPLWWLEAGGQRSPVVVSVPLGLSAGAPPLCTASPGDLGMSLSPLSLSLLASSASSSRPVPQRDGDGDTSPMAPSRVAGARRWPGDVAVARWMSRTKGHPATVPDGSTRKGRLPRAPNPALSPLRVSPVPKRGRSATRAPAATSRDFTRLELPSDSLAVTASPGWPRRDDFAGTHGTGTPVTPVTPGWHQDLPRRGGTGINAPGPASPPWWLHNGLAPGSALLGLTSRHPRHWDSLALGLVLLGWHRDGPPGPCALSLSL